MRILILWVEIAAAIYGLYCEVSKIFWSTNPTAILPQGMGLAITLIAITMITAIKQINELSGTKQRLNDSIKNIMAVCSSGSSVFPAHENDFYALWKEQVRNATNNVDVTHLGLLPPNSISSSEKEYFDQLKSTYSATSARIRRVERWSKEKEIWIDGLIKKFAGVGNFSLAILEDPSENETPFSLSVSRIDSKIAWIVAIAEHSSTSGYRDLMITGEQSVNLFSRYFEERLWKRSIVVMQNGVISQNWKSKLGGKR